MKESDYQKAKPIVNKLHEVINEMLQCVEKIEDSERTLNALPNPGQLIVTGIVKKNVLNILKLLLKASR